jgi:hypothetical protein
MAFQISFTDQYGTVYPESYWRVVQTNICQSDKKGYIVFYGYEDAANKGKRTIGERSYSIDSTHYDEHFGVSVLNPNGSNPVSAAYIYAKEILDVSFVEGEKTSFFADAINA